MAQTYSTFEVYKAAGINRNTLQSAMAASFVVPDIHRADGPSERSAFSRDGVYDAALFFRLVTIGIPRKKAASVIMADGFTWENVGEGQGQFRFFEIIVTESKQKNLSNVTSSRPVEGPTPPKKDEWFRWTVSLLPIKKQVDAKLSEADR
ncbi:MAG: hypothetical protein QNK29_02165 [Desulfobacterales bacterium]|nr:hypothetical protein [Desulfobacterales bacterium]